MVPNVGLRVTEVSEQIERAQVVHCFIDKVDGNKLSASNSPADQKLSPQAAMAMLRDLLLLHDSSFDELHVGEISKLECAVTAEGYYVWANRHEIVALGDKLTPCNPDDLATTHVDVTSPLSPTIALPSSGIFTLKLQLRINGTTNLPAWDWSRTYCKWAIVHTKTNLQLASGATTQHADDSCEPSWKTIGFSITDVESIDVLRECRLVVRLKRPSRWLGVVKVISAGSVSLGDVIAGDTNPNGHCVAIDIPMGQASQSKTSVSCEMSIAL